MAGAGCHLSMNLVSLEAMVVLVQKCAPTWVNIGANTKRKVKLIEPGWEKVEELIARLQEFTEVKVKSNLEALRRREGGRGDDSASCSI